MYAPGVTDASDIRRLVDAVEVPVNVLALPGVPSVSELAALGVKRISVGSAFSLVGIGAVADAAREFLDAGTYGFWDAAGEAVALRNRAFG